jgi:hypothetical protein
LQRAVCAVKAVDGHVLGPRLLVDEHRLPPSGAVIVSKSELHRESTWSTGSRREAHSSELGDVARKIDGECRKLAGRWTGSQAISELHSPIFGHADVALRALALLNAPCAIV